MTAPCPRFGFVVRFHGEIPEGFRELLEREGLEAEFGGGGCAVCRDAGQATEADRVLVRDWLDARGAGGRAEVGPLIDLRARD